MKTLVALVGLSILVPNLFGFQDPIAILGANVVDLDGGAPIRNAAVIIQGDRISAIGPASSTSVPSGARVIQATDKWVIPGLMNMHVHLDLKLPGRQQAALANESEGAQALRMAANARGALYAGITTIRLPGSDRHVDLDLRAAIERGEVEGPRMHTAGESVLVTGGHGSEANKTANDGPYEFRKAVRKELRAGATWIKILISGGIATQGGSLGAPLMTDDEIEAVVDAARRMGGKVTAHSGSPAATQAAVKAGIDSIEHGYFLDEKTLREMKEQGTWLIPTIVVTRPATRPFFEKLGSPDWYMERWTSAGVKHWEAFRTAVRLGVNIALGTDQLPQEPNDGTIATVREVEYYVEAGMTPRQALRAGTIQTATLLGVADEVGSIERGKLADLLLVDEDPTQNISTLREIRFVMKGGQVVRNDL